jgi:hypothetical protein
MAKQSVKHFYTTTSFQEQVAALEAASLHSAEQRNQIESKFDEEIVRVIEHFKNYENEFLADYQRYMQDHHSLTSSVVNDSKEKLSTLDSRFVQHQKQLNISISKENETYHLVLNAFEELRKNAKATFDQLCEVSDALIEKEVQMHRQFVASSEAEFAELKEKYVTMNTDHYNQLLWSMEKSKNALEELKSKLQDQSFQDMKLLNQTALFLLEQLRDTKNKITQLFKTTTQKYARRKDEMERLSQERQIPHSVVNQSLIDGFIRQIDQVNEKKTRFESLIIEERGIALKAIGEKIIIANQENSKKQLERYILQYEIVKSKANYLLKQNTELSDLLITKYQNEIQKLKIDSFRRVEEIKLAYHMPAAFCQNSITLYSNFAFYVNEALDSLDQMLSEFIQNINSYVDYKTTYLYESSKTFEDYKVNVSVLTNTISNKMTDLILEIDHISQEIILLESNNRLEIAQVQKDMEHADITSDYEKHLAKLDNDYFLADYQHELNLKNIKNSANHEANLLQIERTLQEILEKEQMIEVKTSQAKQLNIFERNIHDAHFDYELALGELHYRKQVALLSSTHTDEETAVHQKYLHDIYFWSRLFELQEKRFLFMKQKGSNYVVDYVHSMQKIIDMNASDVKNELISIHTESNKQELLRRIYFKRQRALQYLEYRQKESNRQATNAIKFFHRSLFLVQKDVEFDIQQILLLWKKDLLVLDDDHSLIVLNKWRQADFYLRKIVHIIQNSAKKMESLLVYYPNSSISSKLDQWKDDSLLTLVSNLYHFKEKSESISSHPSKVERLARKTLVESIVNIKESFQTYLDLLSEFTTSLITQDTIFLFQRLTPYVEAKKAITQYYNLELGRVNQLLSHKKRFENYLIDSQLSFEKVIKDRVLHLNQLYLHEVNQELKLLHYIKKTATHEIKQLLALQTQELKQVQKSKIIRLQQVESTWLKFKKGFETMKVNNYELTEKHNRYLDQQLGLTYNQFTKERNELLKQQADSPKQLLQKQLEYQNEKLQLIMTKENELIHHYAHIEEQKYLSRPKFVDQMSQIKNRLEQDYIDKYTQITEAQHNFLHVQQQNTVMYHAEYDRFVASQKAHLALIQQDNSFFRPFDEYFFTTNKINDLTKEVFQTTYSKSSLAREEMKKHQNSSTDNQKRILDV